MIRDVPPDERPRERLMQFGAAALSNAELLAILLRTGTSSLSAVHLAERILAHTGGLKGLTDSTITVSRTERRRSRKGDSNTCRC